MEKIQQSGCAEIIREYVEQGKIYIGSSAGSVLAGPDIYPAYYTDAIEKAPNLNVEGDAYEIVDVSKQT